METLNIKNKLLLVLLLILSIILSDCSNNNDSIIQERLEYLRELGFEFYEQVDTFSLMGSNNIIDILNIKYPFYAIKIDSSFVKIQCFNSPTDIFYTSYRKVKNYYISTKIYVEENNEDFYKEVTIVYPDKIIVYEYSIYDNFEQLLKILFIYKNNEKKIFENSADTYYNICDSVNEHNILMLFPTLEYSYYATPPKPNHL